LIPPKAGAGSPQFTHVSARRRVLLPRIFPFREVRRKATGVSGLNVAGCVETPLTETPWAKPRCSLKKVSDSCGWRSPTPFAIVVIVLFVLANWRWAKPRRCYAGSSLHPMRRARCRHCLVRPFAKIDLGGFCISPQILPHVVSRIVAAECRSPWAVLSPPSALQAARSRRLNARFENRSPEYPANTNCDAANAITPGARMQRPLNFSWRVFHSRSAQAPRG
jgi:hypothetical protein